MEINFLKQGTVHTSPKQEELDEATSDRNTETPRKRPHVDSSVKMEFNRWRAPQIDSIQVGILPDLYPCESLDKPKCSLLEQKLSELILSNGAEVHPKFHSAYYFSGYFLVSCQNQETADWVIQLEKELTLPGIPMCVLEKKNIPSQYVLSGVFPKTHYTTEVVKKFLDIQNPNLGALGWKMLVVTDARIDSKLQKTVFSIDKSSFDALKNMSFCVSYRLGTIQLLPRKILFSKYPQPPVTVPAEGSDITAAATQAVSENPENQSA